MSVWTLRPLDLLSRDNAYLCYSSIAIVIKLNTEQTKKGMLTLKVVNENVSNIHFTVQIFNCLTVGTDL